MAARFEKIKKVGLAGDISIKNNFVFIWLTKKEWKHSLNQTRILYFENCI